MTNHDRDLSLDVFNQYHHQHHEEKEEKKLSSQLSIPKQTKTIIKTCDVGWTRNEDNECVRENTIDHALISDIDSPCDNFYNFACKKYSSGGTIFDYLTTLYTKSMDEIIYGLTQSNEMSNSVVSKFYQSCQTNQNLGSSQAEMLVRMIDNELALHSDIPKVWGRLQLYDIPLPVSMSMELNPLDGKETIPTFTISNLFEDMWSKPIVDWITKYVIPVTGNINLEPCEIIENALRNEVMQLRSLGARNVIEYVALFNGADDIVSSPQEKQTLITQFDFEKFIEYACPYDSTPECKRWKEEAIRSKWWITKRSYFTRLRAMIYRYPIEAWRSYTKLAVVSRVLANDDTLDTVYQQMDLFHSFPWQKKARTVFANIPRERACVNITRDFLSSVLIGYYNNRHVSRHVSETVKNVFNDIRGYYVTVLSEEQTKKIENMKIQIAEPTSVSRWMFEVAIENSLSDNLVIVRRAHVSGNYERLTSSINGPFAFYDYRTNVIHIGSGLLQVPLFSTKYNKNELYSRLGAIIAHEMTHAFDSNGIMYNENLEFVLSDKEFSCFIDMFSVKLSNNGGMIYDGVATLNENIADVVGFSMAFGTYLANEDATSVSNREELRNFYISFAQMYCDSLAPEKQMERQRILHLSHSVSSLRVNGPILSHSEFSNIWNCKAVINDFQIHNCTLF